MRDCLLRLEKVNHSFGAVCVAQDVTLSVERNSFHALIGSNGAGKTSLLNIISGFIRAKSGLIYFNNQPIHELSVAQRARCGLSRTFQKAAIFSGLSVADNIMLANTKGKGLTVFAANLKPENQAQDLSYGDKRKLDIAMSLQQHPLLLLLDEPLAGLGTQEAHDMVDQLRQLKGQITVLMVEHDMDAVFALADRVTVLSEGQVLATGTPQEIKKNAQVQSAYLGSLA